VFIGCSFVDSSSLLSTSINLIAKNGDMAMLHSLQEKSAAALHEAGGAKRLPADLAGTSFVRQTLADNQKKGGCGHEIRGRLLSHALLSRSARGGLVKKRKEANLRPVPAGWGYPPKRTTERFQDYLFRVLIDQAGKLHLPYIFTARVGNLADYFSLAPTANR